MHHYGADTRKSVRQVMSGKFSSCMNSTRLPVFSDTLRSALDERKDVICVLSSDLRIAYCNPAWDRFALDNQGEEAVGSRVLGTNLLDVAGESLQRFYRHVFDAVASSSKPFDFDYECSSADRFRMFRMEIMPLRPTGFLVVHSLRVEEPHSRKAESPDAQHYRNSSGIVTMCSHCRRTRRVGEPQRWDWVPAHLGDRSLSVSHGLCQVCRVYYYPSVPSSSPSLT